MRRGPTDVEVLAQVQAATKSAAGASTLAPVRPVLVLCECGGWRSPTLRVHSPHNRDGKLVDCMGREVARE